MISLRHTGHTTEAPAPVAQALETSEGNENQGSAPPSWSEVHNVKLSRSNCMMRVESLYESSATLSSSAIASSKAVRAILQASSGFDNTSYWKTEKFRARPRRIGCVTARSLVATSCAASYACLALSAAPFFASPSLYSAM